MKVICQHGTHSNVEVAMIKQPSASLLSQFPVTAIKRTQATTIGSYTLEDDLNKCQASTVMVWHSFLKGPYAGSTVGFAGCGIGFAAAATATGGADDCAAGTSNTNAAAAIAVRVCRHNRNSRGRNTSHRDVDSTEEEGSISGSSFKVVQEYVSWCHIEIFRNIR